MWNRKLDFPIRVVRRTSGIEHTLEPHAAQRIGIGTGYVMKEEVRVVPVRLATARDLAVLQARIAQLTVVVEASSEDLPNGNLLLLIQLVVALPGLIATDWLDELGDHAADFRADLAQLVCQHYLVRQLTRSRMQSLLSWIKTDVMNTARSEIAKRGRESASE